MKYNAEELNKNNYCLKSTKFTKNYCPKTINKKQESIKNS